MSNFHIFPTPKICRHFQIYTPLPEFTYDVKFYHKLEISGKAGRSWKLELGRGELDAKLMWQAGTVRRAGKICKILHKLETLRESNICISWKLDKLEPLTARQAGNFKIIKFIFINKFLFLFNFKK